MKEEDTVTLPAYLLVDRSYHELLDEQFDKGWDEGVQAAFDIVQEVLGSGADLAVICARFMRELKM